MEEVKNLKRGKKKETHHEKPSQQGKKHYMANYARRTAKSKLH